MENNYNCQFVQNVTLSRHENLETYLKKKKKKKESTFLKKALSGNLDTIGSLFPYIIYNQI